MAEPARRFNLIDENWIPVAGGSPISLKAAFQARGQNRLGGNPMEKVAITKLLLGIAQASSTPDNAEQWAALGPDGVSTACLDYLHQLHDAFWLYGDRPFLQMPAVAKTKKISPAATLPHISTGNTTVLQSFQQEQPLDDAEKARIIVCVGGYCLGGKKSDNSVVLSPGYTQKTKDSGKPASGRSGAWLGFLGYLHHFVQGESILESIWLNMLTHEDIAQTPLSGLGTAPWEAMPKGESCPVAQALRESLMGRLVPMSKFVFLNGDGFHISDGISYPSHKEYGFDPSVAMKRDEKEVKALWADPEKLPWRNLPSLLAFMNKESGMDSFGLRACVPRALQAVESFSIWAGGVRVSSNAGEQYVSGRNDFVDSLLAMPSYMAGTSWYMCLKKEIEVLTAIEKTLYATVRAYATDMKILPATLTAPAISSYWEMCNTEAQNLLDSCDTEKMPALRRRFISFAEQSYNTVCPKETARQLAAWAANQPRMHKFGAM